MKCNLLLWCSHYLIPVSHDPSEIIPVCYLLLRNDTFLIRIHFIRKFKSSNKQHLFEIEIFCDFYLAGCTKLIKSINLFQNKSHWPLTTEFHWTVVYVLASWNTIFLLVSCCINVYYNYIYSAQHNEYTPSNT